MSFLNCRQTLIAISSCLFLGLAGCPGGDTDNNGSGATGVVVPKDVANLPINSTPTIRPEI